MQGVNVIGLEDIAVTVGVVIVVCGLIVTLWNAIKAIKEMTKPAKDLVNRVDKIESMLANDKKRLDSQEVAQKLLLRGMMLLIEHEVNEGSDSALAILKDDISSYLINR